MKYVSKFEWQTHLGNKVTIDGVDDEHLANMLQYVGYYKMWNNTEEILEALRTEVQHRGLSQEFLDKAQFPYKDGRGNYIVWDFQVGGPKIIGSYKR